MKIVFMYVDRRPMKEKVVAYAKPVLKFSVLMALLMLNTESAAESFKLGNVVDVVRGIPNAIK